MCVLLSGTKCASIGVILPRPGLRFSRYGSQKLIHIYKYLHEHQSEFESVRWMIKTDTDAYVHIPNMVEYMLTRRAEETYSGFLYDQNPLTTAGIWRKFKYVSRSYPPYMAGAGYLVSSDVVKWLTRNAAEGWLIAFPNEDAKTGTWLSGTVTVPSHDARFNPVHRGFWRKIYISAPAI